MSRDPPPGPARLARPVAVQRPEGVEEAELAQPGHDAELRRVPRLAALGPQPPAAVARERGDGAVRRLPAGRVEVAAQHPRAAPRREPGAHRGQRLRLDPAVGGVRDVDGVDLDPGASAGERGLGPGHREEAGQRRERLARREQDAGAARPGRRASRERSGDEASGRGTCGAEGAGDGGQPDRRERLLPHGQRARRHLLQGDDVGLALGEPRRLLRQRRDAARHVPGDQPDHRPPARVGPPSPGRAGGVDRVRTYTTRTGGHCADRAPVRRETDYFRPGFHANPAYWAGRRASIPINNAAPAAI